MRRLMYRGEMSRDTGSHAPSSLGPLPLLTWPGKKEDGTGGDILLWKRKAEMYLIEKAKANPSLSWTIIHPGTSWPR